MSNPIQRGVCPYCGIDAEVGPYAHADRQGCIVALKDKHQRYRNKISRMVENKLQEVKNRIGGVVGYKLDLDAKETEIFWREVEHD